MSHTTINLRPLTVRNCTVEYVRLNVNGYDSRGRYFGNIEGVKLFRLTPAKIQTWFQLRTHSFTKEVEYVRAATAKDARLVFARAGWMCAEKEE